MANVNVTIRMDENMKRQADELFSDFGMSLSGAITVFLKQSLREQAIPFQIGRDMPNRETLEAIEEVKRLSLIHISEPTRRRGISF